MGHKEAFAFTQKLRNYTHINHIFVNNSDCEEFLEECKMDAIDHCSVGFFL